MLIIFMFTPPSLPHSPTQQNVENFLINGIKCKGFIFNILPQASWEML